MPTKTKRTGTPTIELHHRLAISLEWGEVKRAEMAEHLGVTDDTVTNYTKGRTRPGRSVVRDWALKCGVPFDWLMLGDVRHEGGVPSRHLDGPTAARAFVGGNDSGISRLDTGRTRRSRRPLRRRRVTPCRRIART